MVAVLNTGTTSFSLLLWHFYLHLIQRPSPFFIWDRTRSTAVTVAVTFETSDDFHPTPQSAAYQTILVPPRGVRSAEQWPSSVLC